MSARRISGAEGKRPHDGATPHPGLISTRRAPPKRPLRAARLRHRCSPEAMRLCMCHHAFTSPGIAPALSVHVSWDGRRDWVPEAACLSNFLTPYTNAGSRPSRWAYCRVHLTTPNASLALRRLDGVALNRRSVTPTRVLRRFGRARTPLRFFLPFDPCGRRDLVRFRRFR